MHDHSTFDQFVHNGNITHHYSDGEHVSMAVKNVFGGKDYYNNANQLSARSFDNVAGGHDYVDGAGKLISHTVPNHEGGHDIYTSGMKLTEHGVANANGGQEVYGPLGGLHYSTIPLGHNFVEVLHHSDPLMHAAHYQPSELDLSA